MSASAKNKILLRTAFAYLARDKASSPASTTVATTDIAVGATTFAVTSATGLATGKVIRVGDGETAELVKIGNLTGTTVTPARPIMKAHSVGDAVVEQTVYDLGEVAGQPQGAVTTESTEVEVETRRLVYSILQGYADVEMSFSLVGINAWTLAVALGVPFGKIFGTGATNTPQTLQTDGSEIGTAVAQCVILQGLRMDGTSVTLEIWGAENDYTGLNVPLARGQAALVPVKWVGPSLLIDDNAVSYTATTTDRPDYGDLLESISEIGYFEAATTGPLSTTLNADLAAGSNTPSLASSTNAAVGDVLMIGTGDTVEFHPVATIGPVVLATKTYRAFLSGTPVVRMKRTSFGGIIAGSASFTTGGSTDKIRLEHSRTSIGLKPGGANLGVQFQIADATLANIAWASGAPQGDISGGRLLLGNNIGTAVPLGVYLRGRNVALQSVNLYLCGIQQQIQSMAIALQKSGVNGLPFTFRPNSMFQLTVNS